MQASIYSDHPTVVMYLNGLKCKVTVDIVYDDYNGMPIQAAVNIERTDEPLTVSSPNEYSYYKFGGFPYFLQNIVEPCDDNGFPYTYICTIQNEWGDMGNGNVFALIRDMGNVGEKATVENVFVEASCC